MGFKRIPLRQIVWVSPHFLTQNLPDGASRTTCEAGVLPIISAYSRFYKDVAPPALKPCVSPALRPCVGIVSALPDKRDEPVTGALAIFGVAGQIASQDFFFVEQSQHDERDHEHNCGQGDE